MNGEQVDEGDYEQVDDDTLSFPSHASEFGYGGDLTVDYEINDDVVAFNVVLPDGCEDACAYALSPVRVCLRTMDKRRGAQLADPARRRRRPGPPDLNAAGATQPMDFTTLRHRDRPTATASMPFGAASSTL